jgi:hypothetical protein
VGSGTDHPPEAPDRPQVDLIEIVNVPDPGASNGVRGRLDAIPASLWHAVVAVALVAVLVGVVVVELTGTSDRDSGRAVPRLARTKGPAGVAAAYGYPLRCLSVTIPADHRDYARADFSRTLACGRYTWAPTAIFRRYAGAWYRVLDAVQYRCPLDSMPTTVQVQLGVCPSRQGLAGIH